MENEWTKKIKELTESRDQWKLEWGLLMSDLNAANDRNTELEAALKRETNEYIEASHTLIIERDEAREQVKKLEAERDADRKREYGYSQQTVDALTLERDKLRAERNDWKARYQSVAEMHDALIAEFNEMRAENKRLAALNDMFPQEIARLEDRVSAEYEAERADDRARIKELEAERDADRKREYGYSQQTVDALTAERDKLEAENKRLRELVDGARVIVEVFQWSTPAQERWREEWLKKAAKAMKEDDWLKECQENDRLQAALSAAQGEVERLRETLDDIAHVGNYEASQRAIDALKEAKGECHHLTAYYNEEADNYYCSECHRGMGIAYYNVAQALLKTERQKQEIQKSPQTP